MKHVGKGE